MAYWDISEENLAELREELRRKLENPQAPVFLRTWHDADGNLTRVRRLRPGVLPLPHRTRVRLWLAARVDDVVCWLATREHTRAAELLYRACGMWS